MKRNYLSLFVVVAALLAAAAPVLAHHSFAAEFDANKPVTLTGTVTKIEWLNPHTFFYLDVKDPATGKVANWAFEMGSPNGLAREGWTRKTLNVGDLVTVEGSRAKDGSNKANAKSVFFTNTGKKLGAASSQVVAP
jgi:hypothetical protein